MTSSKFLLWFHTLRHLRPVQVLWRIWRVLHRPAPRPVAHATWRQHSGPWQATDRAPSLTGPEEARFLNRTESLAGAGIWNRSDLPKLWLYNLHYFDDLLAREAPDRADWHRPLITRWIAENPAPHGNAWEPYPTSLRLVNWAKWVMSGHALPEGGLASMAAQADWLSRNLEHHLLGNHLFANAKALVFAGAAMTGTEADRWRALGLRLLARELPEQQLPGGGQFELSPMYHALFTEDLLDLVQLAQRFPDVLGHAAPSWQAAARRALDWLDGMTHPDGRIAFFNDGAFGIAPEPAALRDYAAGLGVAGARPGGAVTSDLDGYVRMEAGPAVLICDAAPIGPDYLPGHAHADSLSFELSVAGHRVVVNGGTSVYGGDPGRRMAERSTSAHNTVEVDGQNSSEIWAEFRVARRARIVERKVDLDGLTVHAAHDGYRRFGGALHRRTWTLSPGRLEIRDELVGKWQTATARLRLAPPFRADADGIHGPVPIGLLTEGAGLRIETGDWAPEFGRVTPCQLLCLDFKGPVATTILTWDA